MRQACITVDFERDWRGQDTYGITKGTPKLLKLFKKHKVKATFFVVAQEVAPFKGVLKMIQEAGHEIAVHGLAHERIKKLNLEETRSLISDAKFLFESCGFKPKGYRSPYLITNKWLNIVLREEGFKYDSSQVNAFFPTRYNYLGIPNKPFNVYEELKEVPISHIDFPPRPLSLSFIKKKWEAYEQYGLDDKTDFICFYVHPYEVVNERPKKMPLLLKSTAKVTGDKAMQVLEDFILVLKAKGFTFIKCEDAL